MSPKTVLHKLTAVYCLLDSDSRKCDRQQTMIQTWLDENGIDPQRVMWYADKDIVTAATRRPQFERLQDDILQCKVEVVVVLEISRLFTRLRDGVRILGNWCQRGIRIALVDQQLDLRDSVSQAFGTLLLSLAEIELDYKRRRQAEGIKVAKKNGVYKGRAHGATKSKPDRAKKLKAEGADAAEIAQQLGVSERTVWRYLKSDD